MAKKEDLESVLADLHTLDSKIGLIAQRIRTIEQNEEVIGRTLITLNNKLKDLEEKGGNAQPSRLVSPDTSEMDRKYASKQELKEIRYTLDMINPLDLATLQQVKDLVDEKIAKLQKTGVAVGKAEGQKASRSGNIMESM